MQPLSSTRGLNLQLMLFSTVLEPHYLEIDLLGNQEREKTERPGEGIHVKSHVTK